MERSAAAEAAAAALLAANKAISGRCDEVGRGELHNPGGRVRTGFAPHQAFAAAGSRLDASPRVEVAGGADVVAAMHC